MRKTSLLSLSFSLSFVPFLALAPSACSSNGTSSNGPGASDASAPDAGPDGKYANPGPATVTNTSLTVTSPTATFSTDAYIPSGVGPYPVVILSSGFAQPALGYAPYAQRLASWGILTLLRDDPSVSEATADLVSDVSYEVTTWLAAQTALSTSALYGRVDVTRIGLAGHSRGGQISLLAGEGLTGKIKGVFGVDPVDSASPPQASASLASIGVPVVFLGETTDDGDAGCAPANVNYLTLYAAAASPAVAITFPNADHTMFEDPDNCLLCALCTAGTASQPVVEDASVRYLTAYFARLLLGDTSVGATFDGAGASVDVEAGTITLQSK